MNTKDKKYNVKDRSGLIDELVHELATRGAVRLLHFGLFKVKSVKGRKVYDWKKRKMVPVAPYKSVSFSPAEGLRAMINK